MLQSAGVAERTIGLEPRSVAPWNPQKYYVDNSLFAFGLTVTTQMAMIRRVGVEGHSTWVMIPSQAHFLISYLFHYNVLRRTFPTPASRAWLLVTFLPPAVLVPVLIYGA